MYVYIHIYAYIYISIYAYTYLHTCINTHIYICIAAGKDIFVCRVARMKLTTCTYFLRKGLLFSYPGLVECTYICMLIYVHTKIRKRCPYFIGL